MKYLAHLLLALGTSAGIAHAVCNVGDDVGDAAGSAKVLPSTGYDLQHSLDGRSDTDFFVFTSIPYATYNFTVTTIGVDDLDVCLRASDGSYILDRHNTAGGAANASFSWRNDKVGGLLYVDVRSLGEGKTGTYRLQMDVTPGADGDNDGLPDAWEAGPWAGGSLASNPATGANAPNGSAHDKDGDGFTNFEELQMGTDPTLADSSLVILDIEKDLAQAEVLWPAVNLGSYEVSWRERTDNAATWQDDEFWNVVENLVHTGPTGNVRTDDLDGAVPLFKLYRVRQFGISKTP